MKHLGEESPELGDPYLSRESLVTLTYELFTSPNALEGKKEHGMVEWTGVGSKYHEKVNANLKFLIEAVDKGWIMTLNERSLSCSVGIPAVHLLILQVRSSSGLPRLCLSSEIPQTHSVPPF